MAIWMDGLVAPPPTLKRGDNQRRCWQSPAPTTRLRFRTGSYFIRASPPTDIGNFAGYWHTYYGSFRTSSTDSAQYPNSGQ